MQEDAALSKQVKAVLINRVGFDPQRFPIQITAKGGVVTLRGTLETLRDKRRVELIAREIPGAQAVQSDLRISPVTPKSDEEIARAVRDALEADRNIESKGIDVAVQDGVVTLRGATGTPMQRRVAVATIWWLIGVQDVRDELRVRYPEDDGDADLQDACHVMLDKDPLVDEAEISVLSENGVITLAGAVGSDVERDAAENTIWGIEGVRDVRNHVVVVPGAMPPGQREMGI